MSVGIPAGDPAGSQIWPSVGFCGISDPARFLKPTPVEHGLRSSQISDRAVRGERECRREGERPAKGESVEEIFWTGEGKGIFVFV